MTSTFTFLRVRGIEIGANWSWLLVFALIAWTLGAGLFPRTYPGLESSTYTVMGVVTALLFFGSILLHELGHAFRALKEGMEIDGITLWLFGGVARFKSMFPSAGAEFRIAIAGPIVSVVIAGVFQALTVLGHGAGLPSSVLGVTDYLARINLIVVAFNMVPALPLDGGRVLRSWLWHRQENFAQATVSAAKAGRAFGGLLIGVGILGFITGGSFGGIWFVFLGWFLLQAAQSEASYALLRQSLSGIRVRDLMTPDPMTVPPDMTVDRFVDEVSMARGHSTYPVMRDGELVGMMSIRLAGQVPADERSLRTVRDVMLARDDVPVLDPSDPVFEAVEHLQSGPGRAVVVSEKRVEGLLSMSDVARALELEQVRGPREGPKTGRSTWPVWILVGAVMLAAAAYLYHPPVGVLSPGESFDVTEDISISGAEMDDVTGGYYLTSVRLSQPSGLGLAWAVLQGDRVIPLSAVVPEGQDQEEFIRRQQEIFEQSRRIAAAAAARAVGMEVTVTGNGVRVVGIAEGSPAADVLEQGDVIVEVNGSAIEVATDLQQAIRSRPEGTSFTLTIERDGDTRQVEVRSTSLPETEGAVIGVLIETRDLEVDLPFTVEFTEREIGGPSAGLAYALAVADLLDPGDYARGREIAATGTIDLDGNVGQVGGLEAKGRAAEGAGAELFLVPTEEVDQARGTDLEVRGVATLSDAIGLLRASV